MHKLFAILLPALLGANLLAGQQKATSLNPPETDAQWMQKILDDWTYVCTQELKIDENPLPWIIFYDSINSWHLNADKALTPALTVSKTSLSFSGQKYTLARSQNLNQNRIWIPDRPAISIQDCPTVTMPYANNKKSFFVAPLPSLFHTLSTPDQYAQLDVLFQSIYMHELTHTRQLAFVLPQILEIQKTYHLPESIDDNTIENTFKPDKEYEKLFLAEKNHLRAAYLTHDTDSAIQEIKAALSTIEQRKKAFFTGENAGYDKLEDIFTPLEGSGMWAQYRLVIKIAPPGYSERDLLFWLMQQTASWVQDEGLWIFLLLDRWVPDWKDQFFGKEMPSAIQILKEAIEKIK